MFNLTRTLVVSPEFLGTALRHVTATLATSTTRWYLARQLLKNEWRRSLSDRLFLGGTLVEYVPFTAKEKSRIHQLGKRTLQGFFFGYGPRAREEGQGLL